MNEPTCPHCGYPIDCWETVDESTDVDTHKVLCAGSCPHCEIEYQWWEVYTFSCIENLEECKSE